MLDQRVAALRHDYNQHRDQHQIRVVLTQLSHVLDQILVADQNAFQVLVFRLYHLGKFAHHAYGLDQSAAFEVLLQRSPRLPSFLLVFDHQQIIVGDVALGTVERNAVYELESAL